MSASQAGSVNQAGSGLLSEALNFKERNSSLPCSDSLPVGTTRKKIQSEERGNCGTRTELYSEDINTNENTEYYLQ